MINYLKLFYYSFKDLITGQFKWFAILFMALVYRIEFMHDTGFGAGKMLQVVTVFGLFYLLLREQINWQSLLVRGMNTPVKSITLLYVYAVISTLWAFLPSFAFFLSFQNLIMIMLFTWAFSLFPDFRNLEKGFLFFAFTISFLEFVLSRVQVMSLFQHLLPQGSMAAIMLAYCAGEYLNERRDSDRQVMLRNAAIAFLFFLIINTSGGANASAVVAVGVAMFFGGKKGYALLLLMLGLFLFLNEEYVDDIILMLMPGKNMETIEAGNGRDHIWEILLRYADEKPLFGWGFACIERVNQLGVIGGQSLSDAHSNSVGMYGSLGIVGCILFGWHLLTTGLHLFRHIAQIGGLGLFAAFTCATVNGYSYGFLSGKTCSITITYIMVVLLSYYYDNVPLEAEEDECGSAEQF